jgi:hypothetical protein
MRFTIRDLLWLMVVAGMTAALFVERRATLAAASRANKCQALFEELAEFAAWREDWRINASESRLEIYRPRLRSFGNRPLRPPSGGWSRLRTDSLTKEVSRETIRKAREAEGFPVGPFPEEVGQDER